MARTVRNPRRQKPPDKAVRMIQRFLRSSSDESDSTFRKDVTGWTKWAIRRGCPALPANPADLRAFLTAKQRSGVRHKTLQRYVAAITRLHQDFQAADPIDDGIQDLLEGARRNERARDRKPGITRDKLAVIEQNACLPRVGESNEAALSRGREDIALISIMRDCFLRKDEVPALRWLDISQDEHGDFLLNFRNRRGTNFTRTIFKQTMATLEATRGGAAESEHIFDLSSREVTERISRAAEWAGLGPHYNSMSPRIGMAKDLASAGIAPLSIALAGRWASIGDLKRHIEGELAAHGAVAQLLLEKD